MSHEIETIGQHASFVSHRLPAWHRLGKVFDTKLTAEQALKEAYLGGWNVRKLDLTATELTEDGFDVIEVGDHKLVVRTNPITGKTEPLGVVGADYGVVSNEEQVEFLQALLDEGGAWIETAGSLRGGREVFVTAHMPQSMMIGGVDRVDMYVAALSAHDGSRAFTTIATPTRIVCWNTQSAALATAPQRWSRRHTGKIKDSIQEAREALTLAHKFSEEFEIEAERMIQTTMTNGKFEKIVRRVFGDPANPALTARQMITAQEREVKVMHLFAEADTQANIRGTNWAGYQALAEYEDHMCAVKVGADDKDGILEARSLRAVAGKGVNRKEQAFRLCRVPATTGA